MQYNEKMGAAPYKVTAPTLEDCRSKLYRKFGMGYEIINYQPVFKGGFLGLFQRQYVEAEYVVSQREADKKVSVERNYAPQVTQNRTANDGYSQVTDFIKNRDSILQNAGPSLTATYQLGNLSKQLEKMNEKLDAINQGTAQTETPASIKKIQDLLYQNEFTKSYVDRISERLRSEFTFEELDDFERVQTRVVDWIGKDIRIAKEETFRPPKVIIIVGPTGVGKTTTVAKMAAEIAKADRNRAENELPVKIRLLTVDTMRVAASEQLNHWGDLIPNVVSVESAETNERFRELYRSYGDDYDYLFVDTSGYSPNDLENIAKMHKLLDVKGIEPVVYLAINAGSKAKDIENIIRNFESYNFRSVIITKCDETSCYGNVLSVLAEKGKSVAWVTNGQAVMNTIERAHPIMFLSNLEGFKIDRTHLEDVFGAIPERRINP